MRIVHLVSGGLNGGAARGAYWLHRGLLRLGVSSTLLTNSRDTLGDPSVISLASTDAQRAKLALFSRLAALPTYLYPKRKSLIFSTGLEGINFTRHPAYLAADVVHLHWINGLVAMRTLRKINKPIVWTIRDMWPMTGGCHLANALGCERYIIGCGQCPQLGSRHDWDLTKFVVAHKQACLHRNIRVVGISEWLSACARRSRVFDGFTIQTISNGIDVEDFFPVEPAVARRGLGLPLDKRIVLAGSYSLSDFHKGIDLFLEAMSKLRRKDVHIVLFGNSHCSGLESLSHPSTTLGFLSDSISLRLVYSAADVFVAPSRMESFGKMLAEAMACGTPVVCFDATGTADVVVHKLTGYKAQPFDSTDLCEGIQWILSQDETRLSCLRKQARERATKYFDSRVIAEQYITVYKELLEQ